MKNMFQLVLMLATATQVSSLWGQSFTPIRVTAGTANCTDESTNVWLAGQMTGFGYTTGGSIQNASAQQQCIYQSSRYVPCSGCTSIMTNTYSVTPGAWYRVTLKFAEIFIATAVTRVFDVTINGTVVQRDFDVFSSAGGSFRAVDRAYTVFVSASTVSISLTQYTGTSTNAANPPILSGIEIVQTQQPLQLTTEYVRRQGSILATVRNPTQAFTDMHPVDAYFGLAHLMKERGVTSGCSASPLKFCGNNTITRGEMAVFLVRAILIAQGYTGSPLDFGIQCYVPNSNPITMTDCGNIAPYFPIDVPATHGFFKHIQKIYQLGITSGCDVGKFCPDSTIQNQEAAVFAARGRQVTRQNCANTSDPTTNKTNCDGMINPTPGTAYYTDVGTGYGYWKWIQFSKEQGMVVDERVPTCPVSSPTIHYFCPTSPSGATTRAHMTFFVVRGILGDLSW